MDPQFRAALFADGDDTSPTTKRNQGSARPLPPPCGSSILMNKSSSKPPLRTYSKRALQHTSAPPSKRQRIEHPTIAVKSTSKSGVQASTPTLPKKRSISQFFQPIAHTRTPSSPQTSVFSSDPLENNTESPPSSPPTPYISPSEPPPKKRARRRLIARPPLALIKMSDMNAGGPGDNRKGKGKPVEKGPFYPESPPRTSYLTETSPPGLRYAARAGTSIEEDEPEVDREITVRRGTDGIPSTDPIDIPGAAARMRQAELPMIPFAPGHPYMFRGPIIPRSDTPSPPRQLTFSTDDTLVGDSTPRSQMTIGSGDTLVDGASTRPQRILSPQSLEDRERTELLLAIQPTDPDMVFGFDPVRTDPNFNLTPDAGLITVPHPAGSGPQMTLNHPVVPANLTNPGPSTQVHAAGPSVVQLPSVVAGQVTVPHPAGSGSQMTLNHPVVPASLTNPGPSTQAHVAGPSVAQPSAALAGPIQPNLPAPPNVAPVAANLVQSQLNLGPPAIITCSTCRFTWNRTIPGDIRAHNEAHDNHFMGEPVIGLSTTPHYLLRHDSEIGREEYVVVVDRSSTDGWKNLAMAVLDRHVDRELGAASISEDVLWSSILDPEATASTSVASRVDRFKIYMFVRRPTSRVGRVISLLLAERITSGCEATRIQVGDDEFGPWPSIVPRFETEVSTKTHEAVLGISKLWTILRSRRKGYGEILLDEAREDFLPSYIVPRVHVAWTSPTDDGAAFAKAYTHRQAGYDFLVYDDQM